MNESEEEIVDLDACPRKKSILIGALVATLLSLVPINFLILFLPYTLAGLAATAHFTKRHAITISSGTGAKLGAVAAGLGMIPVLIIMITVFQSGGIDEQFEQLRQEYIKESYQNGNPEMAKAVEDLDFEKAKPLLLTGIGLLLASLSLVEGAIGGLMGAAFYKRGPLAQ